MSPRLVLAVALAAALVAAGCSKQEPEFTSQDQVAAADRTEEAADGEGGGDAAAAEATITFVAENLEFTEAPGEVQAGVIAVQLRNESGLPHDVTIDGTTVVSAQGGEEATGTIELEPGEYDYICSVPGHSATMNGTLTVAE